MHRQRLRPLWNYTTLKLRERLTAYIYRLRPLWNYTTLKPQIRTASNDIFLDVWIKIHTDSL